MESPATRSTVGASAENTTHSQTAQGQGVRPSSICLGTAGTPAALPLQANKALHASQAHPITPSTCSSTSADSGSGASALPQTHAPTHAVLGEALGVQCMRACAHLSQAVLPVLRGPPVCAAACVPPLWQHWQARPAGCAHRACRPLRPARPRARTLPLVLTS